MSSSQQQQQGKRPRTEQPRSERDEDPSSEPQRVVQVQTGNIGTVLALAVSVASPNIQDHDLIGSVPVPVPVPAPAPAPVGPTAAAAPVGPTVAPAPVGPTVEGSGNPTLYQTLQVIINFLTHHRLVVAASSATMTATTAGGDTSTPVTVTAAPYYLRTLEEFALAQLDRQAAGLRTNVNRETAAGVTQLVEAHTQALNANTACNSDMTILLSKEKLCSIHAMLCPTDHRSGRYRTTQARAGNTLFCPPNDIDREMNHLFHSIQAYQRNWNLLPEPNSNRNGNDSISRVYHAIALAAMVLYGINDIHPFADGNGRMARVYANFMLQELLHLPFTITLVATLQQRREYIEGLQHGHERIRGLATVRASASNDPAGSTNTGSTSTSTSPASAVAAFEPLIRMLVERVAHAIVQFQALLTERARAALDEEEARIARQVRERAAAGQCIICLDARPNIATLCCGQAVHLNCIAEWLANGTTCVGCRSPLPRMIQPGATTHAVQPAAAPNNLPPAHDTTTAGEENTTASLPSDHNTTTAAEEDTTTNVLHAHDTTTSSAEEDTTTNLPPAPQAINQTYCQQCLCSRAALDCVLGNCGPCCVMSGIYCPRHNM